jgi:hypothetical protein
MPGIRIACGQDVHTLSGVVDNRHVAVERPVERRKKCRINRSFCQQIAQFAMSRYRGAAVSVRTTRCHTHRAVAPRMTKGTQMLRAPSLRPGRAWPTPTEASRSWLGRRPTRLAPPAADETDAELARDLAVLVESGLVVPIYDGLTVRFALSAEPEGAEP